MKAGYGDRNFSSRGLSVKTKKFSKEINSVEHINFALTDATTGDYSAIRAHRIEPDETNPPPIC